jgi:hypothetical protein
MTATEPHAASPRLVPAVGVFALSLLPGLLAFLPGFLRATWNFTDPVQQSYLTPFRVVLLSFLLVAVFAPFVGAAVALVVVRMRARSWALAFRTAAMSAAILGGFAFFAVMMTGGGL